MSNTTACPLDCYDACSIIYESDKIKANQVGLTQGFLCPHLNHYTKHNTIITPRFQGKEISMDEALLKLQDIISSSYASEILHYRGNGNFALMQEVTDHFFASHGSFLTDGTLCDGAGEAGILEGRGSHNNMTTQEIAKAEVVIFWGRNPHTTSSHLLPLIKDKTVIVIDPIKTKIAKNADLYIQIKPHTDLYLAMLLTRFLHINDACDEAYLEKYASEFEEYYELTQGIRIKATLESMDVTLGQIGKIIEMVQDKKVAIICGVGIQKYADGADVMRAIDAFGVALGLFGKEGCGVAYLGNSKANIISPFYSKSKKVSKVNTPFDDFKTVFIQGANPLAQMPNSNRVQESISRVENIVYFGLYENETSHRATLVLPAKIFLAKDDIRTSYSNDSFFVMKKQYDSEFGISEYDLSKYLCAAFDIQIKSEQEYLDYFKTFSLTQDDSTLEVKQREKNPYANGFDTDDGEFVFLEEYEKLNDISEDRFHLITPKSATSLNSQFNREQYVYLHSSLGFAQNSIVELSSASGNIKLPVKHNDDLRIDCLLIYSGTKGVNKLTSSKHSLDGKSAIYQENIISIQ
ncbi:MAG: molybdopterin-dependent oxidoreductase [Sulfurimonas sp.]